MMKRCLLVLVLLGAIMLPAAQATAATAAFDPFGAFKGSGGACSGSARSSAVCSSNGSNNLTGSGGILHKITVIVAWLAGVVAVILIIISAVEFVTSGGDSGKVATARSALIGAIVGILIVAFAQLILEFVIKGV